MKVLWIAPVSYRQLTGISDKGHAAPWVTGLAQLLKDRVDITIVSPAPQAPGTQTVEQDGIKYVFIKTRGPVANLLTCGHHQMMKLRRWLSREAQGYDIIHIHGTEHQYATAAAGGTVPLVISMQGVISACARTVPFAQTYNYLFWKIAALYEKREVRDNTYFVCRTGFDSGFVRSQNAKAVVSYIWEPVRGEFYGPHFDADSRRIIFLGGLNYMKGVRELLGAMPALLAMDNTFELVIAGHGSQRTFERLVLKHCPSCRAKINYAGYKTGPEIAALFEKSFCFMLPSYIENSPNSVCEAQVSGLPVIVSDVGGVNRLVENGKTGLLIPDRLPQTIAKAVSALKDKELYGRLSKGGREAALARHIPEEIRHSTLQLYERMIRQSHEVA